VNQGWRTRSGNTATEEERLASNTYTALPGPTTRRMGTVKSRFRIMQQIQSIDADSREQSLFDAGAVCGVDRDSPWV
jgi:hypothetical protein